LKFFGATPLIFAIAISSLSIGIFSGASIPILALSPLTHTKVIVTLLPIRICSPSFLVKTSIGSSIPFLKSKKPGQPRPQINTCTEEPKVKKIFKETVNIEYRKFFLSLTTRFKWLKIKHLRKKNLKF
jgi:hypothetical protein